MSSGSCPSTDVSHGLDGPHSTIHSLSRTSRTLSWAPFHHGHSKGKLRLQERLTGGPTWSRTSYQLVLAAVQVMAVVEDILVCGIQTGLHTILYHLAGSWRALQFLHLPINKKNMGPGSCSPEWFLLLELPPNYSRFLHPSVGPWTLPWDEIVRTADGENCLAPPPWPMVFLEVTQEQLLGNVGLKVINPIALDYAQWFWFSMSLWPGPQPSTAQPSSSLTFILKKVMLVSKSTVDFKSWSRSGLPAGKLFYCKSSKCKKGTEEYESLPCQKQWNQKLP